jgi:murein DD-endopeptidase MepM/ murein hydrolase activator NlpD
MKQFIFQNKYFLIIIFVLMVSTGILVYFFAPKNKTAQSSVKTNSLTAPIQNNQSQIVVEQLAVPIADFKARITEKPFGIYITPQNSPVQPERFTGYHTGVDVEYQDATSDVPVYALADGKIVLSRTASGYGGVFMIDFTFKGVERCALYGHIRPSSLPKLDAKVIKGEQIGLLGTGYSTETDGERRHLHFAILSDNRLSILGYVQTKSELSGWTDPLTLY